MRKKIIVIFIISFTLFIVDREVTMENIFKNICFYKNYNLNRYIKYKKNNINLSYEEIIRNVNINLDKPFYTDINEALNKHTNLVLVNKHYYLDKEYIPKYLVKLDYEFTSGIDVLADKNASEAFKLMSTDAGAIGLTIKTISAYRSYEYQDELYKKYLLNDSEKIVDTYSARCGHSEHQTGLAFDIYNEVIPYTKFGDTKEYEWLKINAHKYGFIIRYTSDNSYITGYKNEPWHIRYVGVENATYIYEKKITLEEYILNIGNFK